MRNDEHFRGVACCDGRQRRADSGHQDVEVLASALPRNESAARIRAVCRLRKAGNDLGPRKSFPSAEIELAPARVDLERRRAILENDRRGRSSAFEIARNRALEVLVCEFLREGCGLRASDIVERDVRMALKAAARVPGRASVADDDEFERVQRALSAAARRANNGASAA